MTRKVKQFLRAPKVIVGELVALALFGALGAALPQMGSSTNMEIARLREAGPVVTKVVQWFALDHLFRSSGFLVATALAAASLLLVVLEQVRRFRCQWSQRLTEAHFQSAPLRAEFERPARAGQAFCLSPFSPSKQLGIRTERRIGLLGSPLFHAGLLLVILAGALRALFGTKAVVDLLEGETLPPRASAWSAQFPGILGKTFHLDGPVTLNEVKAAHYSDGDLRDLKVRLSVPGKPGGAEAELAVNHDLKTRSGRLFLGFDFGPAVLIDWQSPGAATKHEAALLAKQGNGDFEGTCSGPGTLRAYLRARVGAGGERPQIVEVRVMKDGALLFGGDVRVGQTVALYGGAKLVLRGAPFWARLRGSHDSALWLAYVGFALVMLGVTIIFGVVKLDWCVSVTSLGDRERVVVAFKPQRFAPLFEERFQRVVQEQQGDRASLQALIQVRSAECGVRNGEGEVRSAVPMASWLRSRIVGWLFLLFCGMFLTSCRQSSEKEARTLVERYNRIVSEAYRRGDVRLIDPVVGPNEGKKLTGLIGVRLDLGITLDSQMLSLDVTGVTQGKNELRVSTRERWSYRDLKIGTGAQVGEASQDSYEMTYYFTNVNNAWLVDEIKFASPPQVGRKQTPWIADRKQLHSPASQSHPTELHKP